MKNRYAGVCTKCSKRVAPYSGIATKPQGARRYQVAHTDCKAVSVTHFPSTGQTIWQSTSGRCEDAPCCGCCSY